MSGRQQHFKSLLVPDKPLHTWNILALSLKR